MNWGTKLMIGMLCFMSFIVVLGILMINSKTDALVDNDYYEKGLNYDSEYKGKEQVKTDDAAPVIAIDNQQLTLSFKTAAKGKLKLMRIADKKMDRSTPFQTDERHKITMPLTQIAKGRWKLLLSWNSDNKEYLYEQEINIK